MNTKQYSSFVDFYPFYLSEHQSLASRRCHFIGAWVGIFCVLNFASYLRYEWLVAAILSGYVFSWIGHFFFEKNKPASFRYPLYSFMGDWAMFRDILRGKVKI